MKMPFGTHKGTEVSALPKHYIAWALDNIDLKEPLKSEIVAAMGNSGGYQPNSTINTKPPKSGSGLPPSQPDSAVWEAKDRMNMGQSAMRSATEQVAAEITAGITKTKKAIDERWDILYTQRTFILEATKNGQHKKEGTQSGKAKM